MLLPAAALIFMVLGALCVDYGGVYVAHRELADAAAAAANDAATQALDVGQLYETGGVLLVPAVADDVARRSVDGAGLDRFDPVVESVAIDGDVVTVRVRGTAHHLFAGAVPGGDDTTDLVVTASATSAQE